VIKKERDKISPVNKKPLSNSCGIIMWHEFEMDNPEHELLTQRCKGPNKHWQFMETV
jgi:hypothetical protein